MCEKGETELCLKLYSVKGVTDLEIADLTLIIMPLITLQLLETRTNFRY